MNRIIRYVLKREFIVFLISHVLNKLTSMYLNCLMKKKSSKGTKRRGANYGSRKGETLLPYKRGRDKGFVANHCKLAFAAGSECVDAICRECKKNPINKDHSCPVCHQNIGTYKDETDVRCMPRRRPNWEGPGPVVCGICEITM